MQSQDQERHDVQEQPATTSTTLAVVDARFERDTSGFNRRVYRLSDGSEVFFRGREETVDVDEALNRESIAVGSSSHWLRSPREPVSGEELREGRKDNDVSAPILMSASKTLTGVLEVARYRSPENKEIQELLTDCKQGIYSERAHILLEELVACNLFGKDGFSGDELPAIGCSAASSAANRLTAASTTGAASSRHRSRAAVSASLTSCAKPVEVKNKLIERSTPKDRALCKTFFIMTPLCNKY